MPTDPERLTALEAKVKDLVTGNNSCVRAVGLLDTRLKVVEKGKPSSQVWTRIKGALVFCAKVFLPGILLTVGLVGGGLLVGSTTPGCYKPLPPDPPPVPPVPPVPPLPPPIPPAPIPLAGFRVLMMYDKDTLTPEQQGIVFGRTVRDYLDAKCVKGEDGKTPDRRIYAYGVDASGEARWIQDAIQRHPGQKSWMVVSDGKTGYDGLLPASADEAMKILQKIGG